MYEVKKTERIKLIEDTVEKANKEEIKGWAMSFLGGLSMKSIREINQRFQKGD